MYKYLIIGATAILFTGTVAFATVWPGTTWIADGEVIAAATLKANLDYLFERRNTGLNFHEPPVCVGGGSALQWDGTDWACRGYSWSVGSWSACSKTCGGGTKTRSVTCIASDGTVYSDSYCTTTKPATSQACNTAACRCDYWYRPADSKWNENLWLEEKTDMGSTYRAAMQAKTASIGTKIRFGTYLNTTSKTCNTNGNWSKISGSTCYWRDPFQPAPAGTSANSNTWASVGAWRASNHPQYGYYCK